MKNPFKYLLPALFAASAFIGIAHAQVYTPPVVRNASGYVIPVSASTTIGSSTVPGAFSNISISGTCTGSGCGGGGGASTSTSNTWGGTQAFGTSTVVILNGNYYVPLNVTSTGCMPFTNATDTGACVMAIYNALPSSTWGTIFLPPLGTQAYGTPIVFARNGVAVNLLSFGGLNLYYNGTGTALTVNTQNQAAHWPTEIGGFNLQGHSSLIVAGQTNTATTTGISCGGTNGCVSVMFYNMSVNGFGIDVHQTSNAYMNTYQHLRLSGGNGGTNGDCFLTDIASNSGERSLMDDVTCTDPGNSTTSVGDIYLSDGANASFKIGSISLDDATIYNGYSNGTLAIDFMHCENSAYVTYPAHPCVYATSSAASTIDITFLEIANDTSGSGAFSTIILHGQNLRIFGWQLNNYGGGTVTYLADHSLNNGSESELICGGNVQGGGLTNIVRNQAYSQAVATECVDTVANSYPFTMYIDSSNVVHIRDGNQDVGTVDQTGNWTLGGAAGVVTVAHALNVGGALNVSSTLTVASNTTINVTSSYLATNASGTIIATTTFPGSGGSGNVFVTPSSSIPAFGIPYFTTAASTTVSSTAPIGFYTSGCNWNSTTASPGGATTTLAYYGPINIPTFVNASSVSYGITTADTSGQVDFGMYTNPSLGSVGSLVFNTGPIATTTGFKTSNFLQGTLNIAPGSYWLAMGTGSSTNVRFDACPAVIELAQARAGSNVVNASGTLPATSTFSILNSQSGVLPAFSLQ